MSPDALSYIATLFGGLLGGGACGWAWMRRLALRGADAESLRQLHAVERKNEEAHLQFDERLRALEIETGRQKGELSQINERLGEILGLLRARGGRA